MVDSADGEQNPSAGVDVQVLQEAEGLAQGLYPHQIEGIAFLLGWRRAILADDMGLGKTRQSVLVLHHVENDGPYLVVCPATVKQNWQRKILIVLPGAQTAIVGPQPPPPPAFVGWVIVNYDVLGKHLEALKEHSWSGVIFDEAHYLKNHRSQCHRFARDLMEPVPDDAVVHLRTGTPLTSRPRDLFPLLQLANHPLGRSLWALPNAAPHQRRSARFAAQGAHLARRGGGQPGGAQIEPGGDGVAGPGVGAAAAV